MSLGKGKLLRKKKTRACVIFPPARQGGLCYLKRNESARICTSWDLCQAVTSQMHRGQDKTILIRAPAPLQ
jgi:hypothetical protein